MARRLELIRGRLRESGVHRLSLAHVPRSANNELGALIANAPVVGWGSGRLARLRQRALRPVASWSRAYAEHQRRVDLRCPKRLPVSTAAYVRSRRR